ncbi:hypothetical protein [Xanthobacter flavus]|uniref:hypothetical protein n=1 Tax=Xanthobacter flavus TaxID=281 RepID=UPI001AE714F7|nr:hypothetical protein [Xanthobacter flavus]
MAECKNHASANLRRAELALTAVIVAIFVLTVSVGAKLAIGAMGYGSAMPVEVFENGASYNFDDGKSACGNSKTKLQD